MISCNTSTKKYSTKWKMEVYENMTPPIIVIASNDRIENKNSKGVVVSGIKGSIILQDSKGTTVTFFDDEAYGAPLINSYKKGDTLLTIVK